MAREGGLEGSKVRSIELLVWLRSIATSLNETSLVGEHIDRFAKIDNMGAEEVIVESVNLWLTMLEYLSKNDLLSRVRPLLCFSLRYSDVLRLDLGDLSQEIDLFEPPSVYILGTCRETEDLSEQVYRVPCSVDELDESLRDLDYVSYYKCWRCKQGIENNWEFNRALFLGIEKCSEGGSNC